MSGDNYGARIDKRQSEEELDEEEYKRMNSYIIISLLSALASIMFIPYLFSIIGILSGYKVYKTWSKQVGMGTIAVSILCGITGIILSFIVGTGNPLVTIF